MKQSVHPDGLSPDGQLGSLDLALLLGPGGLLHQHQKCIPVDLCFLAPKCALGSNRDLSSRYEIRSATIASIIFPSVGSSDIGR